MRKGRRRRRRKEERKRKIKKKEKKTPQKKKQHHHKHNNNKFRTFISQNIKINTIVHRCEFDCTCWGSPVFPRFFFIKDLDIILLLFIAMSTFSEILPFVVLPELGIEGFWKKAFNWLFCLFFLRRKTILSFALYLWTIRMGGEVEVNWSLLKCLV